jgi:hypothetical protein
MDGIKRQSCFGTVLGSTIPHMTEEVLIYDFEIEN